MTRLPVFPLGSVLFPHQLLPLHVFEPRYRELTQRCLDGDRRFGVVLIERGHEVGGGEERFDVGTVAEIVQAARLSDGRWLLETVGRDRFRVDQWLPDDPHPWAEITPLESDGGPSPDPDRVRVLTDQLRRLLALRSELGDPAPAATADLDDDPGVASWQVAILAGLGPLDALRVLRTVGTGPRTDLLEQLLGEQIDLAQARLSG